MRCLLTALALCLSAPLVTAQQQEHTLIDRLLRPNMELQNNSQGKKFVTNSATIERRGAVGTFFLQSKPNEKSFADSRTARTKQFSADSAKTVTTTAFSHDRNVKLPPRVQAVAEPQVHAAWDGGKQLATSDFANQRPFREQGKSQKSLDRQNPPLTIDQVRELLNKNK